MSRQQPFLTRLLNRQSTAAARPDSNRTVRRLQQNFESLENRQLLATMAGLEMAPGEVTDQQQIVVDTSTQSLAERDAHQASDQQASAVIPETLADDLAPAVDINKTDVNTNHLDYQLTSPEIEQNIDHLIRGLEMQPDFSSMDGLAEEIQADLNQFDGIVESMILWEGSGTWLTTSNDDQIYYIPNLGDGETRFDDMSVTSEDEWTTTGAYKGVEGTWTQIIAEDDAEGNDATVLYLMSDTGKLTYMQIENHESVWQKVVKFFNGDDDDNESDDENKSVWQRIVDLFSKDDDDTESDSDDEEEDPDECFPKPWWEDYDFNSISDIAGTDLWMSNPVQTQDVAEFFLNQADDQFLQAMDMIHTQNMWQM